MSCVVRDKTSKRRVGFKASGWLSDVVVKFSAIKVDMKVRKCNLTVGSVEVASVKTGSRGNDRK